MWEKTQQSHGSPRISSRNFTRYSKQRPSARTGLPHRREQILQSGHLSGLNNLQDISLHPAYATMLGYTQQELGSNFAAEIDAAAA
ncbi:MAG: AAA family ATPase [Saprospirales bacterium]|nr:AAA family ATPase [Saprospirales bacterium]